MLKNSQIQSQESGKAVLENLRRLRYFDGDEAEFWRQYMQNTAAVCKSPAALCIIKDDKGWRIIHEFYSSESFKEHTEALISLAAQLSVRAHQNGFAFERLQQSFENIKLPFALVFALDTADTFESAAALIIADKSVSQHFNEIVVRAQLISDVAASYYSRRASALLPSVSKSAEIQANDVAVITAAVMQKDAFGLACMTMANEVAHRFHCSQVSIGWLRDKYVRTAAISHIESFDKHSEALREFERAYEEAFEQSAIVTYPKIESGFVINTEHEKYCKSRSLMHVVSIPFYVNDNVTGILTCEKKDSMFIPYEVSALSVLSAQTAPWLHSLHYKDLWFGKKAVVTLKKSMQSLLGVEHSALKASAILLAAVLLISVIFECDYKVEGSLIIKTDAVSYISAPFEGIIQDVGAQEGDEVKKDSLLLRLDTKELLLKEAQASSETVRYSREADKSRAAGSLADMKIALAKMEESKAAQQKIRYYLSHSEIRAPFDGVLVQGDKQKLKSAPVSKGDVLMKIARIEGMYVHVKVNERDIGEISSKAKGKLIFLSRPWNTYKITVDKIIPMAEVDAREGNVFVIKALIDDPPEEWWRPGMSGVAKIDAGRKKIIWIWTHKMVDFIRMYLWW